MLMVPANGANDGEWEKPGWQATSCEPGICAVRIPLRHRPDRPRPRGTGYQIAVLTR
jgi:hypothetical protein